METPSPKKFSEAQSNILCGLALAGPSDVGNFWLGTVMSLFKLGLVHLTQEGGKALVSLTPQGALEVAGLIKPKTS